MTRRLKWSSVCLVSFWLLLSGCSPLVIEEVAKGVTEGIIEEIEIHNQKADKASKPPEGRSQNEK